MYKVRPIENEEKHPNAMQSPFFRRVVDGRVIGRRAPMRINAPVTILEMAAPAVADAKPVDINVSQTCCSVKCAIL